MLLIKEGGKVMGAYGRVDIPFVKVLELTSFHSHCDGGPSLFCSIGCWDPCIHLQTLMLAITGVFLFCLFCFCFFSGHKLSALDSLFQGRCRPCELLVPMIVLVEMR